MQLGSLPGWVVDDDQSVRDEVADYIGASPAELWDATRRCARTAMWSLRFHADRSATLEYREPVPSSTREALARLRASAP